MSGYLLYKGDMYATHGSFLGDACDTWVARENMRRKKAILIYRGLIFGVKAAFRVPVCCVLVFYDLNGVAMSHKCVGAVVNVYRRSVKQRRGKSGRLKV